jgi:hypothetical protein
MFFLYIAHKSTIQYSGLVISIEVKVAENLHSCNNDLINIKVDIFELKT